jgi:AraC-like DNA-binding protein
MAYVVRQPSPALAPFVEQLWHFDGDLPDRRERILPTGAMALLINLDEDELRSYHGPGYRQVRRIRGACVAGAQGGHFAIDTREQRLIVGVAFRMGGALPFFRASADAVTDLHVELDDVWGRDGAVMRERLLEAPTVDARLAVLDRILRERVVRPLERDPAIEHAVRAFDRDASVAAVTERLGMTARTFHRRFTAAVGLTPKRFARVRRFQRVLGAVEQARAYDWAQVAAACGYYDQAHLIHEFRELAGVTPTAYGPSAPDHRNHVILSDSYNLDAAGEGMVTA